MSSPLVLAPEPEEGNVEYKRQLICSSERLNKLVSQLKFRLAEGGGEAVYYLGVEDDGRACGLLSDELRESLETFKIMAQRLKVETVKKEFRPGLRNNSQTVKIVVRNKLKQPLEVRGVVLGGARNGKSSLVASVVNGVFDDGKGRSRMHVLKHKHELDNGHTSCVSIHALGFRKDGTPIVREEEEMPTDLFFNGSERSTDERHKVVALIDVAGHPKYLKSTLKGLTAYHPSFAIVTVTLPDVLTLVKSADNAVSSDALLFSMGHCRVAHALGLKLIVVITKADLIECEPSVLTDAIHCFLLRSGVHVSVSYNQENRVFTSDTTAIHAFVTSNLYEQSGISSLRKHLNTVECDYKESAEEGSCFRVGEWFSDSGVAAGVVEHGQISIGDVVSVGPDSKDGSSTAEVTSLCTYKGNRITTVGPQQRACIVVDGAEVRAGSVVLKGLSGGFVREFKVRLVELVNLKGECNDTKSVQVNWHFVVFASGVKQSVSVTQVDWKDRECVLSLRFMKRSEYLRPDTAVLLSNGQTCGVGRVKV